MLTQSGSQHAPRQLSSTCATVMLQAALRQKKGEEWTAFDRIEDGARSITAGDVVRLSLRPAVVGTVLHFAVQQACTGATPACCTLGSHGETSHHSCNHSHEQNQATPANAQE